MGKTVLIKVEESIDYLKNLQRKQSSIKSEKRILCLIYLKKRTFKTQQELANHLFVERRTLSGWLKGYREKGIDGIILKPTRNKPSKIITPEIHQALELRVNNSDDSFLGYWDAQRWVMENYNVDIQYHWLRVYMKKHFKTKLKSPRKSHYKKDEKAVNAFLKTT